MGLPTTLKATHGEKKACLSLGNGVIVEISLHIKCTNIKRPDILLRSSCSPVHCNLITNKLNKF